MHIAPDEKIEKVELDYDGKHDRWNGYDTANHSRVMDRHEAMCGARRKYLKEQRHKRLEEKNNKQNGEGEVSDEDALEVDEAKIDESKQMDFAKVEKRVRTTSGGSTGTVRCVYLFISTPFLFYLSGACIVLWYVLLLHGNVSLMFCNRNLRIREDTAKYLSNINENSAYYDPKTRSMREDPLPDADQDEKFYGVSSSSGNWGCYLPLS